MHVLRVHCDTIIFYPSYYQRRTQGCAKWRYLIDFVTPASPTLGAQPKDFWPLEEAKQSLQLPPPPTLAFCYFNQPEFFFSFWYIICVEYHFTVAKRFYAIEMKFWSLKRDEKLGKVRNYIIYFIVPGTESLFKV